jgi:16S rRNA (cytosine967-C5)-methyltransferase
MTTRRSALEILLRVESERAFADVLLGHRLNEFGNVADRRLVTELVLGTLAWQGRLDYELARLSSRPLDELDRPIHTILRLGLYQLRRLTRVPAHAAVDTAVRLARDTGGARVTGVVNAILRAALRSEVSLPDRRDDEASYLAVAYSHPRWLVEKLIEWFGPRDAEAIAAANNQAAPNTIRLNLARGAVEELVAQLARDGMESARGGLFPETMILSGAPRFDSPSYRDGLFTPQSEASQLVARLLAPPRGATVVDCAAAPGGKSTHLAELSGPHGRVIALDLNFAGLRQTRALAARLGGHNVYPARSDSSSALPLAPASVAGVMLDAPCTGLGTLRAHPEIRWRLTPDDPARMARLQLAMLEQAAALVRPGGVIVYAVCSLAPEEGVGVVTAFLAQQCDFAIDSPRSPLWQSVIDKFGFLRTRPDQEARDGFFAARLIRRQI